MKPKRILCLIFYTAIAFLCLGVFFHNLMRGYLLSKSPISNLYLAAYILIPLIATILFAHQAIRHDKKSSLVIMTLTVCSIIYLSYEEYQYYDMRIHMQAVMGPYHKNIGAAIFIKNWPFFALLLGSFLLHPRKIKPPLETKKESS